MADKIIAANSNVVFRHGTQAALDKIREQGTAVSGTFYLTDDSHRLYVGQEGGDAVPVNEGITTVTSINNLPTASKLNAGQFYYIAAEGYNILAVSNGKQWIQINSDTDTVYSYTGKIEGTTDGATVEMTLSGTVTGADNGDQEETTTQAYSFTIKGYDESEDTGIVITSDPNSNTIMIDGSNLYHTLSSEVTEEGTVGTTTANFASGGVATLTVKSADETASSKITINAGNNIAITETADADGNIVIHAKDTELASVTGGTNKDTPGFVITVTDTSGNSKTGTIDPVIAYGQNGTAKAHFNQGTAILDVYTKGEIDSLQLKLDALHYKGVCGETTLPSNNVSIGDVYKANEDFTLDGKSVTIGDLLIAQGTEGDNGYIASITWEIVPSGNEDTTYFAEQLTNGARLMERPLGYGTENLDSVYGIVVNGDGQAENSTPPITVSESWDNKTKVNTLTVNHKTASNTVTNIEKVLAEDNQDTLSEEEKTSYLQSELTFRTVSEVVRDAYGHVTEVKTKPVHIVDTNAIPDQSVITVSSDPDENYAVVTTYYTLKQRDSDVLTSSTASLCIKADKNTSNIRVSSADSGNVVNLSFMWETF